MTPTPHLLPPGPGCRLDAGRRLAERLVGWGDNRTAAIVAQIAEEEKAHVAVGVAWFRWICSALGVDPGAAYRRLLLQLCPDLLKGPFNDEGRREVGLEQGWYDTELWPAEQREAAVGARQKQAAGAAAAAAAARGGEAGDPPPPVVSGQPAQAGLSDASSGSSGGSGALLGSDVSPAELAQLRQRLEHLLAVELHASSG